MCPHLCPKINLTPRQLTKAPNWLPAISSKPKMKFKSTIEHFSTVFNPFLLCRSHCVPQFPKRTGHPTSVQTQGASYCLPAIGSRLPSIWEIHQTLLFYPLKPTLPPFAPKWRYLRHADGLRGS